MQLDMHGRACVWASGPASLQRPREWVLTPRQRSCTADAGCSMTCSMSVKLQLPVLPMGLQAVRLPRLHRQSLGADKV